MRNDETATINKAKELFAVVEGEAEEVVEEPAAEQEAEETAVPQEQEDGSQFPIYEVELPEDLIQELDAPTEEEIVGELEETEEYQDLDEEGRALLARARAAERKAEHYERLRIQDARKGWKAEAEKWFPLSAHVLDSIEATSHRDYLRKAKAAHEAVLPYVKEIQAKAQATVDAEKEKAKAEARAEAEVAWGKTPKVPGAPPTEATITQEQLKRNRAKGDLGATLRTMLFPTKKED